MERYVADRGVCLPSVRTAYLVLGEHFILRLYRLERKRETRGSTIHINGEMLGHSLGMR